MNEKIILRTEHVIIPYYNDSDEFEKVEAARFSIEGYGCNRYYVLDQDSINIKQEGMRLVQDRLADALNSLLLAWTRDVRTKMRNEYEFI